MKKVMLAVVRFITYLFFTFGMILLLSVFWLFKTFPHVKIDELMYQITAPLTGTNNSMIQDYIQSVIIPATIVLLLTIICMLIVRHAKKVRYFMRTSIIIATAFCIGFSSSILFSKLDIKAYFSGENADFLENYYVNPATADVTFPEQKRNLIMIYLESMEMTYADTSVGGAFEENVIPELTEISLENENFSGDSTSLNGAYSLTGTTWTIGALFGSTSGLPLNITIDGNAMSTQDSFFPSITTMGDILEENGYRNIFMIGSDAAFGGRDLYYTNHGNFEIYDYNYYLENGYLPSDTYKVWWGFEDSYLLSFAQEKLNEVGNSEEPFNLTMLTVDTHFEDGYYCADCEEIYDVQYSNVMACSSRQISAFIDWCKTQDWYENTTIVITGDHPTMDSDYLDGISEDYDRRVYTAYINAAAENPQPDTEREYSSFDTFPTTLAALGCTIDGERLGLGTNLYSLYPTLVEQFGVDTLNSALLAQSDFIDSLANIQTDEPEEEETEETSSLGSITVEVDNINIRDSASTSGTLVGTATYGTQYEVYEIAEDDGYTWYLTDENTWIPSDGYWVTYESH